MNIKDVDGLQDRICSLHDLGMEMARQLGGSPWDYERHCEIALRALDHQLSEPRDDDDLEEERDALYAALDGLVRAVKDGGEKFIASAMKRAEAEL